MNRKSNSNELYIQTYNFQEIPLLEIIEQAKEHFGRDTRIEDLHIASERFLERGCSCCAPCEDDYDLYFCIYLHKEIK